MPPNKTVFLSVASWKDLPSARSRAVVGLKWSPWDDFGFKTSFEVQVVWPDRKPIELGAVKILKSDQSSGRTPLPNQFSKLGQEYCSLGQNLAYYEILHKLGPWARTYLSAMRDLVASPILRRTFESHAGFADSLTRSSGAEIALSDAPNLFSQLHPELQESGPEPDMLAFRFLTSVGGNTFEYSANLGSGELDERCAAVIGYNATGKTRLLANIGMIASRKRDDPDEHLIREEYGEFIGSPPKLSGVLAFSYSAFDTFEIPSLDDGEQEQLSGRTEKEAEDQRGYIYCGLRKPVIDSLELKTSADLTSEFLQALERCKSRGLRDRFLRAIAILAEEPSFREYSAVSTLILRNEGRCESFYNSLSTGHKLILRVVTQLVAFLQKRSLVLFDEPEAHLHPSLVAALMKCLRLLLTETSSFAIIATHSPVIIQETPSKNVHILRRNGRETTIENALIETFGENIGILTSEVFNLDASQSDYRHVLQRLSNRSLASLDELFAKPLGTQARGFVRSIQTSEK